MGNHTIDCKWCGDDIRTMGCVSVKAHEDNCPDNPANAKNSPQEIFAPREESACPNCGAPVSSIEYAEDVSNYFTDIKIEDGTYCINPDAQAIFWDATTEERMFCTECDYYFDLDKTEIDFR